MFFSITASDADTAALNVIIKLLADGLITLLIQSNLFFNNVPKSLTRNLPNYTILNNWVFDNFILADDLFTESLWNIEIFYINRK